ncbi:hypothetical protein R6Q57_025670 [Mikania cordata]
MDLVFDSEESSSGCESGWTLYLDHSKNANFAAQDHPHDQHDEHDHGVEDDDEEDDDMSMVSDASSGPPHLQEHQEQDEDEHHINHAYCGHTLAFESRKRRKILDQQTSFFGHRYLQDLPADLDDTASSQIFGFSNKDLKGYNKEDLMEDDSGFGYSQGHSATYFEMV